MTLFIRTVLCCNKPYIDDALYKSLKIFLKRILPVAVLFFFFPNVLTNLLLDIGHFCEMLGHTLLGQVINTIADCLSVITGNIVASIFILILLMRDLKNYDMYCGLRVAMGMLNSLNVLFGLVPVGVLTDRIMIVFSRGNAQTNDAQTTQAPLTTNAFNMSTLASLSPQQKLDKTALVLVLCQWGTVLISGLAMLAIVFFAFMGRQKNDGVHDQKYRFLWQKAPDSLLDSSTLDSDNGAKNGCCRCGTKKDLS